MPILLFNTRFGTYLLATGGNYEGSRDLGIHVSSVKVRAYLISGTLAGLGGIMLASRIGSAEPSASPPYLLNAIAATVLGGVSLSGGRGTILGPLVGRAHPDRAAEPHDHPRVMRLSDEVWVMRQGNVVGHRQTNDTTADELVALITGAKSSDARLHVSDPETPSG